MSKKLLIGIGAVIVVIALLMVFAFEPRCPDPTENIPGTSTYRPECDFVDTAATASDNILDLWVVYDNTEAFQEQIQAFQSNNPGIQVNVKKFVNLDEYEDLIVNEIAEGEGPDIFMIHNSWLPKHLKKLLPMPADQPIVMTPDIFRQTFFQAAADELIVDEQIYGIPLSLDNLAIFYNKQHFQDLIATSDSPADLWEGIQEQVIALTKPDNSPERFALAGIAMGRSDNITSAVDILYALMLQYGVEFYDDQEQQATFANTVSGIPGVDNPGVEALELYTSFGLSSYRNYSWNESITGLSPTEKELSPFVRGKVSMIIGYPYIYETLNAAIQGQQRSGGEHIDLEDIGIAPFPQLVSPDEATSRDTYASYFPLVVARTTDMPQEAWSLVQFLSSADGQQTYHKLTNRPTSRKDMVTEQQTEPVFGTFAFQAPFAKSFKIYDDDAYRRVFAQAIDDVVKNTKTAQQALTDAQQKITCIVQKEKGLLDIETDCEI